jgi:branched-chain amino acid transport system permease protein
VLFLLMLRIVASPLGSVLQAVRENEMRAEAIGYRVVAYRTAIFCIAAVIAALVGVVRAVWLRYTGPRRVALLRHHDRHPADGRHRRHGHALRRHHRRRADDACALLPDGRDGAGRQNATASIPILPELLHPDRWLLWLGVAFILLVYFFPAGIAGTLMGRGGKK